MILDSHLGVRFWSSQTGNILTEYETLRQEHVALVGQSSTAVVASATTAEEADNASTDGPTDSPAALELDSCAALESQHGIELRCASECAQVELVLAKDKSVWLLPSQNKTIAKHCVIGGFGTGQWLPEAECSEPGIPFACPHGDRTLFQLDEASFAAEAQGFQTMTLYKLLLRAEREKNLTEHRLSFMDIKRKPTVEAGEDGFEVTIKAAMTFRCLRDPRSFAEDKTERITAKNFFAKCVGPTLPKEMAQPVCRYRFERVGQNFKVQRPYMITTRGLTLHKDKPLKLT